MPPPRRSPQPSRLEVPLFSSVFALCSMYRLHKPLAHPALLEHFLADLPCVLCLLRAAARPDPAHSPLEQSPALTCAGRGGRNGLKLQCVHVPGAPNVTACPYLVSRRSPCRGEEIKSQAGSWIRWVTLTFRNKPCKSRCCYFVLFYRA